jgi:Fe/S biogenesis protein NfuA
MTSQARDKILAVLNDPARKTHGLRLTVTPNGHGTPQYGLSLVDKETPGLNDMVVTVDGIRFYLDRLSTPYVDGATIDYANGAQGEGFVIKTASKSPARPPELPPELAGAPPTGPDAELIQKLLDEQINPGLSSHGGEAALIAIKENIVYIKMSGGCQGCGSATLTLKQGISTLIKKELPHIKEVLDVTDHAAGTNPFYRPNI